MAAVVMLTLGEAVTMLNPPLSERQLRMIIRALCIPAAGQKRTGRPGHPAPTYLASEIFRLHGALLPWLQAGGRATGDLAPKPD